MAKIADRYFQPDPWKIIEKGFDPDYSRVSESVFSLSNESLGVRGFPDEGGSVSSLRGCYTGGVFALEQLQRSYKGIVDKTHFMIPTADWLCTELILDGETLDLGKCRFTDFERELDMQQGTLRRSFNWHTASGKTLHLVFTRFLDMVHGERGYQCIELEALNFSGQVQVGSGVSFDVLHEGRGKNFWSDARIEVDGSRIAMASRTDGSGQEVFAGSIWETPVDCTASVESNTAMLRASLALEPGKSVCLKKKAVVVFDGSTGDELWQHGLQALDAADSVSVEDALQAQKAYWAKHWQISDIVIEPADPSLAETVAEEQQGIRFCSFQLAQTYSGKDVRHNIGAKGLTGEAYNGHAFWDTEACCLPFYLFTNPEAARYLLMFRYNTLKEAMNRAKMLDCKGACYPIATLNGDEACNLWQHASLQMQPSTAVAYGIRHYVMVSGDTDFLRDYGCEMLIQISRYLVSRVAKSASGKYGYYGVMGPDEFHMMVNNNAYTNYMGKRSLEYTLEVLETLRQTAPEAVKSLEQKLELSADETAFWQEVADNKRLPQTDDGLIEQHDGYFDLPHIDVNAIPISEFPLYDHWSYDRIYRTDMIKQPDVLMILYLYNTSFSKAQKERNYSFYEPRTIHESSLSPSVHSILAAELGMMEDAVRFFGYATRLDLDNYNRNTGEGLHTTSIAMAWANIVYGFAGLRSDGAELRLAPVLPNRWKRLQFSLYWKGRTVDIDMQQGKTLFRLRSGADMPIRIYDSEYTLTAEGVTVERV